MAWVEDLSWEGKTFSIGAIRGENEYSFIMSSQQMIDAGDELPNIIAWFKEYGYEWGLVRDFRRNNYDHYYFSEEQRKFIYHSQFADDQDRYHCFNRPKPAPRDDKPSTKKTKPGYVYLIRGENGYYKIGKSSNAKNRIESLGVVLPFTIEPVCIVQTNDMHGLEKELHARFSDKRISGEWFVLNEQDVSYIRNIQ